MEPIQLSSMHSAPRAETEDTEHSAHILDAVPPKCTKRTHIWVGSGVKSMICIDCGRYFNYAQAAIEKHRER